MTFFKTFGITALIAALIGGAFFLFYVSAHNNANKAEKAIVATWEDNENILAQYGQKISEAAQIPAMQADDLVKIFTETLDARYGSDGSQATFQWIQEQNPNLDQSTYRQLMTMIEAGRARFEAGQTKLIDQKRAYETQLGSFLTGRMMAWAGYPKIDLAAYKTITTRRAAKAFATGEEDPIQLRPDAASGSDQ